MKNTFRLCSVFFAASSLMISTAATASEGLYVQGDVGLANLKVETGKKFKIKDTFKSLKNSYKDSGFMPRVSVGYDFGNHFRVAGDYTHYKSIEDNKHIGKDTLHVNSKANSAGVSAIYDIPLNLAIPVQPYVGARVAVNKVKSEADVNIAEHKNHSSDSSTKIGVGAMVGAGYALDKNLTVDAGYRYNRISSDVTAHEVSAGIRYTFR